MEERQRCLIWLLISQSWHTWGFQYLQNTLIGRVEALHVLAKSSGTQSAGALETTLVDLAQVVSNTQPKLILADELEAITEPGAGARIIAGMLRAAQQQSDTSMVLVTHLAPAILEAYGRTFAN